MWFIRIAALALPLIAGSVSLAGFAIFEVAGQPPPTFTPAWQTAKVGGGGLMNNMNIALSDGTMVVSANTYGAYLYRSTGTCAGADNGNWGTTLAAPCWEQLFTQTSAPQSLVQTTQGNQGVLDIEICNNNTADAYAFTQGNLYVTTNLIGSGASRTWAKTPLTNSINANQGVSAGTSHQIACDPANPNIVYAGTLTGLHVAANGLAGTSASFSTVSGVGSLVTLPNIIEFDPTSSTQTCAQLTGSPTCTKHFWVATNGTGVYETYNGGSSFTLTTGGPTTAQNQCAPACFTMRADKFGTLWMSVGDATLHKYVPNGSAGGGTWSAPAPNMNGNGPPAYLAVDPTASSAGTMRVVAINEGGSASLSTNGGSTWTALAGNPVAASAAGQPTWQGTANQGQASGFYFLDMADALFDGSGNLWNAAGLGTWEILSANVSVSASWNSTSAGIENMVSTHIDTPPGLPPLASFWDQGVFLLQNPDVFPSIAYISTVSTVPQPIEGGWAWDWASSTPTTVTAWVGDHGNFSGSSSDGGHTWTTWSAFPALTNVGGNIAASTATNWILVAAAASNAVNETTNGAGVAGWTASTGAFSGAVSGGKQFGFGMAADRVTANTFCLTDSAFSFWSSTNSGASFTKVNTSLNAAGFLKNNDALKAVPGQAGVFYFSAGNNFGGTTTWGMYKVTKTTSECDTVAVVNANITNVYGYGYGAPKPGGNGFPTIYFWGAVSGVIGTYEIDNGGTTASLINVPASQQTWANNSTDFVQDVSGDGNVYGRVYVCFSGSSCAYIDKQDACPWVNFSNTNPNAALTGTVTLSAQHSGLVPVTSVSFYVDGSLIGTQTTGSGTPTTYSQSWVTGGVAHGAHTLTVSAIGNGCNTPNQTYNSFTIPITTSQLIANDNTPMWLERVG